MIRTAAVIVALSVIVNQPGSARSQAISPDCPASIAGVDGIVFGPDITKKVRRVYKALGCETEILAVPGRRGIFLFNSGHIAGEVYRLKVVEKRYTRRFVRSERPVFTVHLSRWGLEDRVTADSLPVGFRLGIVWAENAASAHSRSLRYFSDDKMFSDFSSSNIGSFFIADETMDFHINQDLFQRPPVKIEEIGVDYLYHYLDEEYVPFMKRFDAKFREIYPDSD